MNLPCLGCGVVIRHFFRSGCLDVRRVDPSRNSVYLQGCRGSQEDCIGSFPPWLEILGLMSAYPHGVFDLERVWYRRLFKPILVGHCQRFPDVSLHDLYGLKMCCQGRAEAGATLSRIHTVKIRALLPHRPIVGRVTRGQEPTRHLDGRASVKASC